MRLRLLVVPVVLAHAVVGVAEAAPCACDHVIELDMMVVNGTQLGVQPGQSVCVRGGPREYLRLQEFVGAEGAPIVIRNCEGQVVIDNEDRGYGLTVDRSRYVRVTGSGEPDIMYGFKVRAARTGPDYAAMGVAIGDLSSDIEADHMEVYDSGFAGFMVKTDPRCDGSANLGNFVMYNTKLHHNYIHDTHGEGIYFGSTGYGGRPYVCDGMEVTLYPHEHHGAEIYENIIENTGWDGAQIGVTPVGCAFYRNVIKDVGLAGELYQWQGLQVGGASVCEIWGNVVMNGPANGLFIAGAGDTRVYNNVIVGFGESGIYVIDGNLDLGAEVEIAHNTIDDAAEWGIVVFGELLGPGAIRNNAVTRAQKDPIGIGVEVVDFVEEGNQVADDPDDLGFVDWPGRDFHLLPTSVLRDAGVVSPELWVSEDLEGTPRDDGAPDVGAYEYSEMPATTGETSTSEGDPTTGENSGGSSSAGTTTSAGSTGGGGEGPTTSGGPGGPGGPAGTGSTGDSGVTDSATGAEAMSGGEDGCACNGAGTSTGVVWMGALVLAALRRRRRG